jgi:hypothetical protein
VSSLRRRRLHLATRCRVAIPPIRPDLVVVIETVPNEDSGPTMNRGAMRVPARQVGVGNLAEAIKVCGAFISSLDLVVGNWCGQAGLVLHHGKPICRVSYDGKLWAVDQSGKETGERYAEQEGGAQ